MSYEKFKPLVWASEIETELEAKSVFLQDCYREYEGLVRNSGDSIMIPGTADPTITETVGRGSITLSAAETVEDTDITMIIDRKLTFNYKVDDIDKRQAEGNILQVLNKRATIKMATKIDQYIASLAADKFAVKDSATAYQITDLTILTKTDDLIQKLYENNVDPGMELVLTCPPRFYFMFKRAYIDLDTNNSSMIANGRVGRYGPVTLKMSNNVATANSGAEDLIMLRTKDAIAAVIPMTHTEPYRPEAGFADAVKGFSLYNAKIIRPKQLIVMNVKYTV